MPAPRRRTRGRAGSRRAGSSGSSAPWVVGGVLLVAGVLLALFLGSGGGQAAATDSVETYARSIATDQARQDAHARGEPDSGPAFDERVQGHMRWARPVAEEVSALAGALAAEGYSKQEVKQAIQKPSALLVASAREGAWAGGPNKTFRALVRRQLQRGRAANSPPSAQSLPAPARLSEEEIDQETERRMRPFILKEARAEQRAKESRSGGIDGLSEGSRWRQASDARIRAEYARVRREVAAGR